MSDLYLIAHVVRGEPAFDIATQIEVEDETIWIIPTSGHRAYPYWSHELVQLVGMAYDEQFVFRGQPGLTYEGDPLIPSPPEDWPDHYTTNTTKGTGLITNLASILGLVKPTVKIDRRV